MFSGDALTRVDIGEAEARVAKLERRAKLVGRGGNPPCLLSRRACAGRHFEGTRARLSERAIGVAVRGCVSRQHVGPARRSGERAQSASRGGGSNSVVESQPSKLLVAGSIPVSRSRLRSLACDELRLGKPASEVCPAVARSATADRCVAGRR